MLGPQNIFFMIIIIIEQHSDHKDGQQQVRDLGSSQSYGMPMPNLDTT